MHFATSLLGASALAMFLATSAQAQDTGAGAAPPLATDKVSILYSNDGNIELATEEVLFNTCYASENAFLPYSYLTFAPKNSTINFYTDSNCETFTFGLDGYYGGYPGAARSYKWVGWDETNLGEYFNKVPISGQGDAATPGDDTHTAPPGGLNPGTTPPATTNPDSAHASEPEVKTPDNSSSSSSTFFGGVVGSLVVLSVGGLIFWKTAGKKLVEDKGKGVLPYNRVGGHRDGDILLTNSGRGGQNSFEIGDEDDEEDEDEVDSRRQHRSGRQERYRDDQA
ncbi:hypothetical protein KI688_002606 [Linnemannia hyalina]|uniref:Uncharacterized protein n=1 Tax=Linnemannia hyalina TaxID=64524 RepID=A0A9P7XQK7_9FUNG|nr:hypothetical protein KI688_002606 [Linnemannia hyalina]